jgi:hypothetical protein
MPMSMLPCHVSTEQQRLEVCDLQFIHSSRPGNFECCVHVLPGTGSSVVLVCCVHVLFCLCPNIYLLIAPWKTSADCMSMHTLHDYPETLNPTS